MPPALYTQKIIAFIWDFDRTLTPGYMQRPLFDEYGVDHREFWKEVNGLAEHYAKSNLLVSKDTAYLSHILSYIEDGHFGGLTNAKLKDLGALIPLCPGMPGFMGRTQEKLSGNSDYLHYGITVEHYVVSTGLRQMILGTSIAGAVKDVWGSELIPNSPGRGYLNEPTRSTSEETLRQVGYTIDNTSKTRAIFEINKGANHDPGVDVNAVIAHEQRRVPFENMIYIADGPSDVPVFSLVQGSRGTTFGVYTDDENSNFKGVKALQSQGRIMGMGRANYTEGSETDLWLMETMDEIASKIVKNLQLDIKSRPLVPGHIT